MLNLDENIMDCDFDSQFYGEERGSDTEDASEGESLKFIEDEEMLDDGLFNPFMEDREEKHAMKDQIYREKLELLKQQLKQLEQGIHPEIVENRNILEQEFAQRRFYLETVHKWEKNAINTEYQTALHSLEQDFYSKEFELKECLTYTLIEEKKACDIDVIDINSEFSEPKILPTRKLRRRPNDVPIPSAQDRRRRTSPSQISLLAEEDEISNDLKAIQKASTKSSKREREQLKNEAKALEEAHNHHAHHHHHNNSNNHHSTPLSRSNSSSSKDHQNHHNESSNSNKKRDSSSASNHQHPTGSHSSNNSSSAKADAAAVAAAATIASVAAGSLSSESNDLNSFADARIENGKLFFEKKWFHRGQNVLLIENGSEDSKAYALILQIGNQEIFLRKSQENIKTRVTIDDLHNGKYSIHRRS